jgi:starch phosphorylase
MKVLVNGGINLSELDGWWAEAYTPDVGWALGDGLNHGDDPARDTLEANALYHLLEQAVIPEFYDRDERGVPIAWIKRMRESMARLTPRFSANRAVREYTERYYLPAATAYRGRARDKGAIGRNIADWEGALDQKWNSLRFGGIRVNKCPNRHEVEVEVFLNGIEPDSVRVQLYADAAKDGDAVAEMTRARAATDSSSPEVYCVALSSARPLGDYTARVVPAHAEVSLPLEYARIAWQR